MKKHLIAAAVAAAVAVPAMAQVTISGVLDVGYGSFKNESGSKGSGDDSYSGTITNVIATSNIRLSGSEDLGGGLKAGFNFVQEFSPSSGAYTDSDYQYTCGTSSSSRSDCQGGNFQDANVSLSGGFGSIKLGKITFAARDAGGVGRFAGNFDRLSSAFRSLGDKTNAGFEYTTPNLNGFTVSVATADDTNTTDYATGKQQGIYVRYAQGPLVAAIGSIKVTDDQEGAGVTLSDEMKNQVLAVQYDFGTFKAGLIHASYKDKDNQNEKRSGLVLNIAYPLGNGMNLHGSLHDYEEKQNGDKADSKLFFLGLTKDLSKRTQLYAVMGQNKTDDDGDAAGISASIAGATANETNRTYAIGVRHSF